MSVKIHIEPEDVWSFFNANPERMEDEMVAIAENEETKYAIFLTDNDCGSPLFVVCRGDKSEVEEAAVSEKDCHDTAQRLLINYLHPVTVFTNENTAVGGLDEESLIEIICEREDELSTALRGFLGVVLGAGIDAIESVYGFRFVEQVLDDFCEYLATDHLVSIYRPTIIETDGGEEFVERPYDDIADISDDNEVF